MLQLLALPSVDRLPILLLTLFITIGALLARLALVCRAWFLAVSADLVADVALDQVFALGWGRGSTPSATALLIDNLIEMTHFTTKCVLKSN